MALPTTISKFLISGRVQLAIAAVVVALAATGAHKVTSMHCVAKISEIELAHSKALAKAQAEALDEIERQKKIAKGVDNDYQAKIADIRSRYDAELERVRRDAKASARNRAESRSAGNCPRTAAGDRLPWQVQEDLVRLMQLADEQTQRLISCQKWVSENE